MSFSGHSARKRFGQHWLRDASVLQHIVDAAELGSDDRVLEVGAIWLRDRCKRNDRHYDRTGDNNEMLAGAFRTSVKAAIESLRILESNV